MLVSFGRRNYRFAASVPRQDIGLHCPMLLLDVLRSDMAMSWSRPLSHRIAAELPRQHYDLNGLVVALDSSETEMASQMPVIERQSKAVGRKKLTRSSGTQVSANQIISTGNQHLILTRNNN